MHRAYKQDVDSMEFQDRLGNKTSPFNPEARSVHVQVPGVVYELQITDKMISRMSAEHLEAYAQRRTKSLAQILLRRKFELDTESM